jgi:hypothetical protein
MVDLNELRYLALSFPESSEEDHQDRPSFRVNGKIFATLPDDLHVSVMLDPQQAQEAMMQAYACCAELCWGKRLIGITVDLSGADLDMLAAAITCAWRRKAPAALARLLDPPAQALSV